VKALICDDERIHLDILESELMAYQAQAGIEVQVSRACTGFEALKALKSETFDAAFLDIGLKGMTGIELAEKIRTYDEQIQLIFVTSHGQFRDQAFDLFAFNYLTKPVETRRFVKVMDRLMKTVGQSSRKKAYYAYKTKGQVYRVEYRDILFFEKCRNHLCLHTPSRVMTLQKTIKELLNELDPVVFMQCHQGFVVNMQKIRSVKGSEIGIMDSEKRIPIGRTFHESTMRRVMQSLQERGSL
jgi:DNA-binding LytR/AlgR family response regulator